jgi:hypothetical protein
MQNDSGERSSFSVIRFVTMALYLQYMNIKVNDICKRAMNAFQKYLFSMRHIFPLLPLRTRLSLQKLINLNISPASQKRVQRSAMIMFKQELGIQGWVE